MIHARTSILFALGALCGAGACADTHPLDIAGFPEDDAGSVAGASVEDAAAGGTDAAAVDLAPFDPLPEPAPPPSSPPADAGPPAGPGVRPRPDGGPLGAPMPSPGVIDCGGSTCALGQTCCFAGGRGMMGPAAPTCSADATSCARAVACDEKADCPGDQICCSTFTAGGGGMGRRGGASSACAAANACTGQGASVVCKVDADCPADRPRCCAGGGRGGFPGAGLTCRAGC